MDREKNILREYTDACELIKETEEDIRRLCKGRIVRDKVKGSNPEFPYQPQNFSISGVVGTYVDGATLEKEWELLKQRKEKAERIKLEVEGMLNQASVRMQRIIRYKIFEGLTWEQAAVKIGGRATAESIKKEYQRFFREI